MICQEPEPDAAELARRFTGAYFEAAERDSYGDYTALEASLRQHARRLLPSIVALVGASRGNLLEVGCAAGYFLDEARSAGWAVSGVEPNGQMAERARSLLGLDVQTAQLGNASALDAAEVVVLLNVLEHLPAPRAVERQLSEVVRPGGILFLETWDAASVSARLLRGRWHQWSPLVPYYHCRRSLDALFPASRWQPACWRKSAKWIPLWRGLEIVGIRAGATLRHRWPWRWHVPYQTGDLVQAAYRRLGS